MAFRFGPLSTVNGLILYYDANKSTSYPGSGTQWKDISKNSIMVGTGGTTYNTSQLKSFSFDGSSNYILGDDPTRKLNVGAGGNVTMEFIINVTSLALNQNSDVFSYGGVLGTFGGISYGMYLQNISNQIYVGYLGAPGFSGATISNPISLNTWQYIVLTVSPSSVKRYIRGQLAEELFSRTTYTPGTSNILIGVAPTLNFKFFNGNISLIRLYNRVLAADEILNNYQLLKQQYPVIV